MSRLLVHVEGQTEEAFVNAVARTTSLPRGVHQRRGPSARECPPAEPARRRESLGGGAQGDTAAPCRTTRPRSPRRWWTTTACRVHGPVGKMPPATPALNERAATVERGHPGGHLEGNRPPDAFRSLRGDAPSSRDSCSATPTDSRRASANPAWRPGFGPSARSSRPPKTSTTRRTAPRSKRIRNLYRGYQKPLMGVLANGADRPRRRARDMSALHRVDRDAGAAGSTVGRPAAYRWAGPSCRRVRCTNRQPAAVLTRRSVNTPEVWMAAGPSRVRKSSR